MGYDANTRHTAWAEIDLNAVRHNLAEIRRITGGKEVLAVIKGNAYGSGMVKIAETLEAEDVNIFGVAGVSEAIELRESGIKSDILNLVPFAPDEADSIIKHDIVQSVFLKREIEVLNKAATAGSSKVRVHAKVDTGLGRLGIHFTGAAGFLKSIKGLEYINVEGVFSVFAEDPEFDPVQLERFKTILTQLEENGILPPHVHMASSAAVMDFPKSHFNMVRPGGTLLGIYPNNRSRKARKAELIPALSLKTKVARVASMSKGERISYRRKHTVEEDTRIATLPMGYNLGYPPEAVGKAEVLIRGRKYPVVAGVHASVMLVDVGNDESVTEGDEVVLIGRQGEESFTEYDLSVATGIPDYRLVASLSPRLPRVYINQ
ncbi:MAG: alanine racemase [Planctomycetota bacterium]|jgi:alanine racemase